MDQRIKQFNYPVKDLAQAKKLYSRLLGVEPYVDSPYYVGFRVGGQEIGLDPNASKMGITGPVPFFEAGDIKSTLQELVASGAQVQQDARDVGGGMLVAYFKDADGNVTGLIQQP
jgi:predicted enzyme related to lactoylglutathione lyase